MRSSRDLARVLVLLKNWVCLLVGVEPIDTAKPKIRRGKSITSCSQ